MKLRDHLTGIYERLGKIDANLGEHMRRTELLERRLDAVESSSRPMRIEFDQRQANRKRVKKLVASAVVTLLTSLLLHYLTH